MQELKLRRFCEQAGSSRDVPDAMLAECLAMLGQRRERQAALQRENEAIEYKLQLRRREVELAEALQRAEAAEAALRTERSSQRRAATAKSAKSANEKGRQGSCEQPEERDERGGAAEGAALAVAAGADSPRATIEALRTEKLVGGSTDPAVRSLQATLGRALEKLSSDLYSSSDHFFSELVQNSDDNTYADGVAPRLRVLTTSDAVLVENNEQGFSAEDVTGLCNVGATTKARDGSERERIGRKGIGFKSVFMVSDAPHICSRGFSWSFDTLQHGLFGFVVPTWVERPAFAKQLPASVELPPVEGPGTLMHLPLKHDGRSGGRMRVDVKLEPASLLFLRRLREIQVSDAFGFGLRNVRSESGF